MKKYDKEVQQAFLDNEKAVLKKLEKNYRDALIDINSKIEALMARQDADLTHVIYQIQYQKALKTQVQSALETLQANEFETVAEYLAKSYEDGFVGALYSIQEQGVPFIFPIDQEQVVTAIQHETKLSVDMYTALGHDIKDLNKKIASEISRGISTGMMYSEIARNVANMANIPKNNAIRIARTEAHRIQSKAAFDAQKKAKSKGADVVKEWNAFLDGKTRSNHIKLDGQIRELDEHFEVAGHKAMFPGDFDRPEEDINCRCSISQRARWALNNEETKLLGNVSRMPDKKKEEIAEKLKIPVDELAQYSDQIVPIKAKNYEDFKQQYKKLWRYDDSQRVRENVQKMKPEFVPAKSVEEAQEIAKQYIGSGYSKTFKNEVDYKGISLDNANEINKALGELYAQYNMPKINGIKVISSTSAQGKKVFSSGDAVAAYNPVEHGIFLNKDILKNVNTIEAYNKQSSEAWETVMRNINNLSGSQKELALLYKNAGRSLVGDGSVHDYIVHEMGHHVQWNVLDTATNNAMGKNMSKYAPRISGYANASKGEYIAESFASLVKGETDMLDPVFVEFMKKGIVKTSNSDIISAGIEYAKRNTSVLPTVYLPKDEYAYVISEINTHMSDEQRALPVVSKAIGNHVYTFENHGFDEYRIIGKVPIEGDMYDEIERIFDEIG